MHLFAPAPSIIPGTQWMPSKYLLSQCAQSRVITWQWLGKPRQGTQILIVSQGDTSGYWSGEFPVEISELPGKPHEVLILAFSDRYPCTI